MRLTSRTRRRTRLAALTAAFATSLAGLTAITTVAGTAPAHADDDNTLTVVGTSDVFDSHLVQDVIEPGFEKAYPQYDLKYVSQGTGAAINYAKAGSASAMIVHAAALENQFVADGYSAEPYGRAIFWGDYVLLGPSADPAGVMATAPNDIVSAFEKVAAAGRAGTADFVSRGGTPGTTVQEHAIWSLTDGTTTKCDVSDTNGGGQSPSTSGGACGSPISYPSWYHATGLTQGPNIQNGDACNYSSKSCYVFTDRGTFAYLQKTGAIANLKIVTRDNDVPGQLDLLINSFHAYAINPDKFSDNPNVKINTAAAQAFLDWLTDPANQKAIGQYLPDGNGKPAFIPSAAPNLAAGNLPGEVTAGQRVTVTGKLTNVVPGTPSLNGVPVALQARLVTSPDAQPVQVATAKTNANGVFSISYTPQRNLLYTVATDRITKIENANLDPDFGDILVPTSTDAGQVNVRGVVNLAKATGQKGAVAVQGTLKPGVVGNTARISLFAGRPGQDLTFRTARKLASGSKLNTKFKLGAGRWRVQVKYTDPGKILPDTSQVRTVRVR